MESPFLGIFACIPIRDQEKTEQEKYELTSALLEAQGRNAELDTKVRVDLYLY